MSSWLLEIVDMFSWLLATVDMLSWWLEIVFLQKSKNKILHKYIKINQNATQVNISLAKTWRAVTLLLGHIRQYIHDHRRLIYRSF